LERFFESLRLLGGGVVGVVRMGLRDGAGGFEGVAFGAWEGEAED
jgi:hypothetical protein